MYPILTIRKHVSFALGRPLIRCHLLYEIKLNKKNHSAWKNYQHNKQAASRKFNTSCDETNALSGEQEIWLNTKRTQGTDELIRSGTWPFLMGTFLGTLKPSVHNQFVLYRNRKTKLTVTTNIPRVQPMKILPVSLDNFKGTGFWIIYARKWSSCSYRMINVRIDQRWYV